jgi:hypothetical protein
MVIGFAGVDRAWPAPPPPAWHPGSPGCRPARPRTWSSRWRWRRLRPATTAVHRRRRPGTAWTRPRPDRPGCAGQVAPYRPEAEGIHTHPLQVDAAGLAELVQQQRLQLLEHPALAHSSRRRQQVVALPQPSSLAGSRLQGVLVRAMKISAAPRQESTPQGAHGQEHSRTSPNPLKRRQTVPDCPLGQPPHHARRPATPASGGLLGLYPTGVWYNHGEEREVADAGVHR